MLRRYFLCLKNKAAELLSDAIFNRVSDPKASYFSLFGQRKVAKRNPPFTAYALCAGVAGFLPVYRRLASLFGLIPMKTPVLGAVRGS